MSKRKRGRPTTLTSYLTDRIVARIEDGFSLGAAGVAEGVGRRQATRWRRFGMRENAREPFRSFAVRVNRALRERAMREYPV